MADATPSVRELTVEDGVDFELDIQVKILEHGLDDDPLIRVGYQHKAGAVVLGLSILRRVVEAVDAARAADGTGRPITAEIERLANEAERLDRPDLLPSANDRLVVKTISGTLGWVLGWSDQPELPEEHQDDDTPEDRGQLP